MTEGGGRKTEDRGRKTEDGGRKFEAIREIRVWVLPVFGIFATFGVFWWPFRRWNVRIRTYCRFRILLNAEANGN